MRVKGSRTERSMPPRPYLPPSCGGAIGALVAAAVVMESGWGAHLSACGTATAGAAAPLSPWQALGCVAAVAVLLLASGMMLWRYGGRRCVRSACLVAAWLLWAGTAALGAGAGAAAAVHARSVAYQTLRSGPAASFVYVVAGDPSMSAFGARASARALDAGGTTVATVSLSSDEAFEDGDVVSLIGRFEDLAPDAWGKRSYMAGEVVEVQAVYIRNVSSSTLPDPIGGLRRAALDAIDPAASVARALVAGIVCGRTTELNASDASDAFSRTGTTHLVAVSGSHLALVAALVDGVLGHLSWSRRVRAGILLSVMAGYVVFTGGAASALRSLIMVGSSLGAGLLGRRAHGISGLMLSVMALSIADPGVVYDLGFQLSAASVLFILVFGSYVTFLLEHVGLPNAVASALALTLCAQWATLPITVPVFSELSLIAPVANLLLGPAMSALLVVGLPCVAVAALVPAFTGVLVPALALSNVSVFLARALARVPFSSVPMELSGLSLMALYALGAAVFVLWRLPARRACGIAALLVVGHFVRWSLFAPASLTVLDVGQGDAILLREGASTVLVDAGVDEATAAALVRNNVYALDAIVVTHWDRDHWGGLPAILDLMPVNRLIVARGAAEHVPDELDARDLDAVEIAYGDALQVGGFCCKAVWPERTVAGEDNEDSLVLAVRYGKEFSALLTGDAEADELEEVAEEVGKVDVLKLGHHGSAASVDGELLVSLQPRVAVASAGEDNSYGHPAPATVEAVEDAGALFVCTIDAGDVTLCPSGSGFTMRRARP
ncbi:DNA internalization-related competence protein ComEC/Rec2 [Collinsella sp. An2]|uniref:DNA internalization-related competence protein ComEC/Rec2 n=1 Tax=Collinsella sp. An2 TaxID=1965585 RepID=UPI000B3A988A|nr:DNA internalization-related competence protein ComEC/Rec2 [Collinsella sp. An2]OUP07833.1 DNA internalization-related competence protein ComEC/Rec2 [Collinsella sp. An2]